MSQRLTSMSLCMCRGWWMRCTWPSTLGRRGWWRWRRLPLPPHCRRRRRRTLVRSSALFPHSPVPLTQPLSEAVEPAAEVPHDLPPLWCAPGRQPALFAATCRTTGHHAASVGGDTAPAARRACHVNSTRTHAILRNVDFTKCAGTVSAKECSPALQADILS